ncbi:MAG TPA: thymidine phosphorylase [Gemmataceae bacterium]|jgi:pyrimidine-nucleoside phosphorylase|nr:thymidine phosphorylase [Gemmataceae bacterium]
MRAVDIIRNKRDGRALSEAEIQAFVSAATAESWPDYQLSAMLMAIWLRGMSDEETAALTKAMTYSGVVLDLSDISGPKADKHSTGGVGDSTSLVLVPLAAACGVVVPMMSGRGLGHTGGTLDKLEAIPGFRVGLSPEELKAALRKIGAAMIGQTGAIAPADRKLYALRDVTSTVESIPLISASIMSKKLAEGIDALMLDVKFGAGAFMKRIEDSRKLAQTMVSIGKAQGVKTEAVLSDMNAPLGLAVGNALEVIECLETLKGRGPARLETLSLELAGRMVRLAGVAQTQEEALAKVSSALHSGQGVEKFRQIVEQQGGNPKAVDDYRLMPLAPKRLAVTANRAGFVSGLEAEQLGRAAMLLGAGRDKAEDAVDPGAGLRLHVQRGDPVKAGDTLVELFGRDEAKLAAAAAMAGVACRIGDAAPAPMPLIVESLE